MRLAAFLTLLCAARVAGFAGARAPRRATHLFNLKPWQTTPMPMPDGDLGNEDVRARVQARTEALEKAKAEVAAEAAAPEPKAPAKKDKKGKKKGKKAAAPVAGLDAEQLKDLVRLEKELAGQLAKTKDGGVVAQPENIAKSLRDLVDQVEALTLEPQPMLKNAELAYALMGDWELRFTDNPAFLKSRGISGTASLPFCKLERMLQRISNERPTAQLVEIVKLFGGRQAVVLKGEVTLMEGIIIDQAYTSMDVSGVNPDQKGDQSWRLQLKCSYAGDEVFIGRSASGSLWLYTRLKAGELEGTIKDAL